MKFIFQNSFLPDEREKLIPSCMLLLGLKNE